MKTYLSYCKTALFVLFWLSLSGFNQLKADVPQWLWAVQGGGASYNSGYGVATDQQGNIYATGQFQGNASFGGLTLNSNGSYDAFVVKYDPTGVALWAQKIGGSSIDQGTDIAVDDNGNIYVTGYFSGTLSTPAGNLTSYGSRDIFIAKLNNLGNIVWVKQMGSTGMDEGNGIAADILNQRIYVNGKFESTLNLSGTNQTLVSAGAGDVVVASYSFDGNYLWANRAGGSLNDFGFGIGVDAAGFVYGTAFMFGNGNFGGNTLATNGSSDIVVFKLNHLGNWIWAKNYGGTSDEIGWAIAVKPNGDHFVTGVFSSENISFGNHQISNSSIMQDIFLFKQDAGGIPQWAIGCGGAGSDFGRAVTFDNEDNCYLAGDFTQTANFGLYQLSAVQDNDVFLAKVSPFGNVLWVRRAGGLSGETCFDVTSDVQGNITLTGYFLGNISFDNITLNAVTEQPMFLAKLKPDVTTTLNEQKTFVFNVYPNPAGERLFFQIEQLQPVNAKSIYITNALGQTVLNVQEISAQSIDVSRLKPGRYFIRISTQDGNYTSTFVKD